MSESRSTKRPVTALQLWRSVASRRARRLVPTFAAGVLGSASNIGLLATSAWLVTRASLRPPILSLSIAIAAVQAFALARGLSRYCERLAVHGVALEALARLRLFLYDHLEPLVPGGLRQRQSGGLLSAFVTDADAVGDTLARGLTAVVDVTCSVAIGVLAALLVDRRAGLVLAAGSLAVLAAALLLGPLGRGSAREEAACRAELADAVVTAVRSAPELVAYGREDLVLCTLQAVHARLMTATLRGARVAGAGRAAANALAAATTTAVVAVGISEQGRHRLSPVMLAVVVFVTLAVLDACAGVPEALASKEAGDAAASRIGELATLLSPAPEPCCASAPPLRPAGVALLDAVVRRSATGTVPQDSTRAGSGECVPVLEGISLAVPPGRRVALVGPSGAGKSTAVLTLLHFLECSGGRATVGDTDVRSIARADLRDRVGWVPEDGHVFAATLGTNLRLGAPSAGDARCTEVLARVGLDDFLTALPDGLETQLGAGGRPLSAGERQRLSLARALLADPDVLLLDEPTAHLDPVGAEQTLHELLDASGGRGALVVSHDPVTLSHVDEVVTLEAGRVTRRQLSSRSGTIDSG